MNTSDQKRLRLDLGSRNNEAIFEKGEDRWGHRILIDDEGRELELLRSIEGNDQQAWPPSPPIQDLDQHSLSACCQAVLGVGGAGRCHWSASFSTEILSDENKSEWESLLLSLQENVPATHTNLLEQQLKQRMKFLFVEIACLVRGNVKPEEVDLQSSYRIGEGLMVERQSCPNGPVNSSGAAGSVLAIQSNGQIRALIAAEENTTCELLDGRIVIAPDMIAGRRGNSVGWSYRIAVCEIKEPRSK